MDFRTKVGQQIFGVRETGLIIRDQQIYLTQDKRGIYYPFGGAIEVGESSQDAVRREIREELGLEVQVDQLAFVVENHFQQDGYRFHNMEWHYLVTPLAEPRTYMEESDVRQPCQWVSFEDLGKIDIRPVFLQTALPSWSGDIVHIQDGK